MRYLLAETAELTQAHRERIAAAAAAQGWSAVFASGKEAQEHARAAEVILSGDRLLLKDAGNLRWLCLPSAGAEQYLDPGLYASPDVILTNSAGAYGVTIAEHIVMVTLEMLRRRAEYDRIVAARSWKRDLPIRSICGSRVTILGTGDLGSTAVERLRGFGPASVTGLNTTGYAVPGFDRVLPILELDSVLPDTDLLVMTLPGTPQTAGLMDARRLALLPESSYLVNVGRGSALDQTALMDALQAGRLAGAALDVFETEPIPAEDSAWECPHLLITPHIAGNMTLGYTLDRIVDLFLENFERYCNGQPLLRVVERQKGY